jgi:hypothetical protein
MKKGEEYIMYGDIVGDYYLYTEETGNGVETKMIHCPGLQDSLALTMMLLFDEDE